MHKPTLKEIAAALGLSASTVSRAMNGHPYVSKETVRRVNRKARELGYVPNAIAKSLKTKVTRMIGVIIPDMASSIFPEYVRGILNTARDHDYQAIMMNTDMNRRLELLSVKSLISTRVDGIILTGTQLTRKDLLNLKASRIPFVVARKRIRPAQVSFVDVDNIYGGYLAGEYLIDFLKRTKLAFIGARFSGEPARDRLKGFQKSLSEHSIEPIDIVEEEPSFDGGYKAALRLKGHINGLFAYNDIMAVGALMAFRESKIKVPEEVAVVGYDDIPLSSLSVISLTTVHQPLFQVGQRAVELLISMLSKSAGDGSKPQQVWLKPWLVRRSTA